MHNLSIETAGTEEEAAEGLEAALGISTQEIEVEGDGGIEGAMELRNWLLRFGCVSEELRVVVAILADWMANPPPPGPLIAY